MNEGVVVITSDAMRGNAYRADAHLDGTSMGPSCWWSSDGPTDGGITVWWKLQRTKLPEGFLKSLEF